MWQEMTIGDRMWQETTENDSSRQYEMTVDDSKRQFVGNLASAVPAFIGTGILREALIRTYP